jgi:hypothetical protein
LTLIVEKINGLITHESSFVKPKSTGSKL